MRCKDYHPADLTVFYPPTRGPDEIWKLLQGMLLVNWDWDFFVWDLADVLRLLTTAPSEFNYLFLTAFLKARAAYLACKGPFSSCSQQMIMTGLGTYGVQFASIYQRLFVRALKDALESDLGEALATRGEARLFQLAIAELEEQYREILEVICLGPELEDEIHGLDVESWVTGTELRNGKRVSAIPEAVRVKAIVQRSGRFRLVRACARDMIWKIRAGDTTRSYLERAGVTSGPDLDIEKLSRFTKVAGYGTFTYGDLNVQYYLTLTNHEKRTLYVVCADRTMRIHQRSGTPPACHPNSIEPAGATNGEQLYVVTFDSGDADIYAIDFRPHKENEHEHVPNDLWRMTVPVGSGSSVGNGQWAAGSSVGSAKGSEQGAVGSWQGGRERHERCGGHVHAHVGVPGDVFPPPAPTTKLLTEGENGAPRVRVNVTVDAEGLSGAGAEKEIAALREHMDKKIDGVGKDVTSLKIENQALREREAGALTRIAKEVDPLFFYWIFVVLGAGSVSKAAKLLKIPNSTLSAKLKRYAMRGDAYDRLYRAIDLRRRMGVKSVERFNEEFAQHQPGTVGDEDILKDLLEGLEALNETNWQVVRSELIALIEEVGL